MASEQEAIEHLQARLPRDQLLDGARGVNDFVSLFKSHLAHAMDARDPADASQFVVTDDLVRNFVAELQASKQRRE